MASLKFKICRRLGENIWHTKKLTPKQNTIIKLVIKKNTSRKQSDFSKKLQQLKKLAYFYGIRSLNKRAISTTPARLDKKKSLLLTLETRLDVILVRVYFCSTLFTARQFITHNKICVNFNLVNIPGFTVRNGDIISIIPSYLDLVKSKLKYPLGEREDPLGLAPNRQNTLIHLIGSDPSYHLEVNYKTFHAVLLYEPIQIHFPYKIELDLLF
jgi:ribosomal protein S4